MDPVVDPEVAPLHGVADHLQDAGALPPAPLTTLTRRARRLRARRRVGAGLAAVVVALAVVGGVAARPGPGGGAEVGTGGPAGSGGALRPPDVDLIVFLGPRASAEQIEIVGARLDDEPHVQGTAFVELRQAFEEFRELFADAPELVDSVRPEVLPTSFRVDAADEPAGLGGLIDRIRALAGVREVVTDPARACRRHGYEGAVSGAGRNPCR
jgi:hypothetical protein